MQVRELRKSDIPMLLAMHKRSGYAYEFPPITSPMFEVCLVVVDDEDEVIAACLSERIAQLYLICGRFSRPSSGQAAIRMLHETMQPKLAELGYRAVDAYLPPDIDRSFGRRLMRSFGWVRNEWRSYSKHFKDNK